MMLIVSVGASAPDASVVADDGDGAAPDDGKYRSRRGKDVGYGASGVLGSFIVVGYADAGDEQSMRVDAVWRAGEQCDLVLPGFRFDPAYVVRGDGAYGFHSVGKRFV